MVDVLYSKRGKVFKEIGYKFLNYNINEKIDSINSLSNEYEVGRGTIQNIIKYLEDENVIKLLKQGRNGTMLKEVNILKLLKLLSKSNFYGVLPLPYTLRYEGLATGLKEQLKQQLNSEINLSYMKGMYSRTRLLIERRVDFAIFSLYDANKIIQMYPQLYMLLTLKECSYVTYHVKVKNKKNPIIIGEDTSSPSHTLLVKENFKGKKFVQIPYNNLKKALNNKTIDATILNFDDIEDENFEYEKIKEDLTLTQTAILIHKDSHYLTKILDLKKLKDNIENMQKDVLSRKIYPTL